MNDLDKLKKEYNHNLKRYYNGCAYCEEHRDEVDKWLPELFRIQNNMNELIDKIREISQMSDKEILEGFEL